MVKLKSFQGQTVIFTETVKVKEGVEADIYTFSNDTSKDLAIVRVTVGYKTPLQRILKGEKTIEGFLSGKGTLAVRHPNETQDVFTYPDSSQTEVTVRMGDIMHWSADTDLTFYEICWPPYEDGRFEDLS